MSPCEKEWASLLRELGLKQDLMESGQSLDILRVDSEALAVLEKVCAFFSLLFKYPDKQVQTEIRNFFPYFNDFFLAYLKKMPELPEGLEPEEEYVFLFVNNYSQVPALPYLGMYLEDSGLIMGRTSQELKQIYAEQGFALQSSGNEPEDHLHIVLEFLAHLFEQIGRQGCPPQEVYFKLYTAYRIFCQYLIPAMAVFKKEISRFARQPFYLDLARALENFASDKDELFKELIKLGQE